jgi:NAD(P)-dependent dehydrogenase (short-subunit alcohol dehydrogenase family)
MTTKLFDLKGKVAIVTGGNGGIGLGMARGLADAGADIAVVGRNAAKSKEASADLASRGVKAIAIETDVTDKGAVAAMADRVIGELGRIDILVNNLIRPEQRAKKAPARCRGLRTLRSGEISISRPPGSGRTSSSP